MGNENPPATMLHLITEKAVLKKILRVDIVSSVWFTYYCVCYNGKLLMIIACNSSALQKQPYVNYHDYSTH